MSNTLKLKKVGLPTFAKNILYPSDDHFSNIKNLSENFFVCRLSDVYFNGFLSQPFISDFYSIYFLEKGYLEKIHQIEKVKINSNELYFTKPGEIKKWQELKGSNGFIVVFSMDYLLSLIDYKKLSEIFKSLLGNSRRKIKLQSEFGTIIQIILNDIFNEYHSPNHHSKEFIKIRLLELLIHSSRIKGNENGNDIRLQSFKKIKKSADFIYEKFLQMLDENHQQILHGESEGVMRVSYFATQMNINPTYFTKCIRQVSGRSAKKHINERLLILAKCQLIHTQQNISEISYSLGFESPSYFIRFFKKFEKMTPVQFRDKNRFT